MPEFINEVIEAYLEDQEGELSYVERSNLQRIQDDPFLYELVKKMMIWACEQCVNQED